MSLPKIKSIKFKFIHSVFQNKRCNLLVSVMHMAMVLSGSLFFTSPLSASIDTLLVRFSEPCFTDKEINIWLIGDKDIDIEYKGELDIGKIEFIFANGL